MKKIALSSIELIIFFIFIFLLFTISIPLMSPPKKKLTDSKINKIVKNSKANSSSNNNLSKNDYNVSGKNLSVFFARMFTYKNKKRNYIDYRVVPPNSKHLEFYRTYQNDPYGYKYQPPGLKINNSH